MRGGRNTALCNSIVEEDRREALAFLHETRLVREKLLTVKVENCDVLVIGGGGAGLRAAVESRKAGVDVILTSKSAVGFSNNTFISYGVFAAAGVKDGSHDSPEIHLRDTLIGGRFINDSRLVTAMVKESPAQISFLEECGVNFLRKDGRIEATQNPGHSYPRQVRTIVRSGKGFILPLKAYAQKIGIRFFDRVFITKIVTLDKRIVGATGLDLAGRFRFFSAKCIVLATGGFGRIYLHTDNAAGITGDGQVLAHQAGVQLKDMEFVQFYPTALGKYGTTLLVYEPFVFRGAVLRNAEGVDILRKYGMKEPYAMTRDRVSRAVMKEIRAGGGGAEKRIALDLKSIPRTKLPELGPFFPSGRFSEQMQIPVTPTVHFCMGGVVTDERAETSVEGLFASGEVCGGIHGANRLGGNAICEIFAMGAIAGRCAALKAKGSMRLHHSKPELTGEIRRLESIAARKPLDYKEVRRLIREIMWLKCGISRDAEELQEAADALEKLTSRLGEAGATTRKALIGFLELCNQALIAKMVCASALLRTESRGSHFRSDYPEENNSEWLQNIVIRKTDSGFCLERTPVKEIAADASEL